MQLNTLNDSATGPYKVNSLQIDPRADPMSGVVTWDPWRSLWNGGMLVAAIVLAPRYFTWGAFAVFVGLLGLTMCTGHSVGFHRRLIHRTFQCPKWLEHLMVWSGTLVGMQGPFWVIQSHDFRDWAQRQPNCHPYLRHGQGMLKDAFWNLHCRLKLEHPPGFDPGPGIGDDRFYQFLQRTWMLQQLPLATVALSIGRHAVAGVGSLRARHDGCVDALVRRLHLSFARPAKLACQQRRDPGAQRSLGGDSLHGRELAQQSSCVSRFGASRPVSGTDRHWISVHLLVSSTRPGQSYTDAAGAAASSRHYAGGRRCHIHLARVHESPLTRYLAGSLEFTQRSVWHGDTAGHDWPHVSPVHSPGGCCTFRVHLCPRCRRSNRVQRHRPRARGGVGQRCEEQGQKVRLRAVLGCIAAECLTGVERSG